MSTGHHQIIMNFNFPPSIDDFEVIASEIAENFPEEFEGMEEKLVIEVEDIPDDLILSDNNIEDCYELLALLKPGNELEPGVNKTNSDDDDVLVLYRRPILDYWCEEGEDLPQLIRRIMIEEIARYKDFSEEEIEEILLRHHQGML